jgi:hypothetical protein
MDKIYIYLLNEGTDCWRPVDAKRISNNCIKIISVNPDPEDENWEFQPGAIVRCEERELSGGRALVAVEQVNDSSS